MRNKSSEQGWLLEREKVLSLEFATIYRAILNESAAFLFLCFYFFMEYVRPQTIYPELNILPFSFLAIVFTFVFLPFDNIKKHPVNFLVFSVYGFMFLRIVSSSYSIDEKVAAEQVYIYYNWILLVYATLMLVVNEKRFVLFLFLYLLWNFKMSQHGAIAWAQRGFGFAGWGMGGPMGWFQNSGEYGLQMAMVCMISLGLYIGIKQHLNGWRKYLVIAIPVTSFMSVLSSSSRGDYLALIAGLLWIAVTEKGKKVKALLYIAIVIGVGYLAVPNEMLQRFTVAGNDDDYTSYTRETRWKAGYEIFKENMLIGVGTGA